MDNERAGGKKNMLHVLVEVCFALKRFVIAQKVNSNVI